MKQDKVFTKEDILNMLDSFSYDIEHFRDELDIGTLVEEDNDSEVQYIQAVTLDEWKSKVIGSLPNGGSLNMRLDIEELLDGIKNIYSE